MNAPIEYLKRIRQYYLTLGYEKPYQWANFENVPFTKLRKPLNQSKVALITTAALHDHQFGDQGPSAAYNASAKFYQVYAEDTQGQRDVRISHVGYDRKHTDASDSGTWFPLAQLEQAAEAGEIAAVTRRFYGLPTNRSQATTLRQDCPALLNYLTEDLADVAVLVPNCPVCHQSCCLAARHLEQNGIATVVMGCAKDIVEHVGVPRLLFNDFPLGNGAGKPGDIESQKQSLSFALRLLDEAEKPRTTFQSPLEWSSNHQWKQDFYNIDAMPQQEIDQLRRNFDQQKEIARQKQNTESQA